MNEKMTSAIEEIVINEGTFSNEKINPSYINFFYGKNGSGKTSISRQIESGNGLKWKEGEVPSNYQLHIYNQDYIDLRFKTLDKVNGIFTLNEGNEEDEEALQNLEEERKALEKRNSKILEERKEQEDKRDSADKTFKTACLRNTDNLREKFATAFEKYSRNPQLSQRVDKTTPKDHDEAELEKLFKAAFDEGVRAYPLFTPIDSDEHIAKIPTCPLLGESITSSGTTTFANFVKEVQSLPWIEAGHRNYKDKADGLCPYCHQPLPEDFEAQLASCYDEQYQKSLNTIQNFKQNYRAHMGGIYYILQNAKDQETLPSLAEKKRLLEPQIENFVRAMQGNMALIDEKIADPTKSITLEDLAPLLSDLSNYIDELNETVKANNDMVSRLEETKEKCITEVWELVAYRLAGEVKIHRDTLKEVEEKKESLNEEERNNIERIASLQSRIVELGKSSTTIQAAIDDINMLLHDSGFEGFEIIKSDAAKEAYKVVRGDKQVAVRLSEGEKHFLAFLYFYNQVKGCDENGVRNEKIVVIDDPVSSLDGNALFIISSLVRDMIEVCFNNSSYGGDEDKGDYIKQLFILTHNAQFHRSITYNQVGRFRNVNLYKINKVNNHSTITPCVRDCKEAAATKENYNPVKNAYAALWSEYRELEAEIPLMNVIHRILDFYFLDMCCEDGMDLRKRILVENRKEFLNDPVGYHLADSMLQYMGAGISGDMDYVGDEGDVAKIREVFERIFKILKQEQHYRMMMERAR